MSFTDWLDPRTSDPLVCCDAVGRDYDEFAGWSEAGDTADANGTVRGGSSADVGAAPGAPADESEAGTPDVDVRGALGRAGSFSWVEV